MEKLIKELDSEKNRDVKTTVKEVDRHFNSIFSILLPNVKAKLEEQYSKENPDVLTGLALRVAFNDQWK